MKKLRMRSPYTHDSRRSDARAAGFTLIELLVAMVVFLVVAGTAFSVFDRHMVSITRQESSSAVNLELRNATAQLQMDLSGAGGNLLAGVPGAPDFSAGVIIQNNVPGKAAACTPASSTYAYPIPSACFDSLKIFGAQTANCPVLMVASDRGPESLTSSSIVWGTDPTNPAGNNATDASCYHSGDELLVIEIPTGGGTLNCAAGAWPYCISAVTLTKQALVAGSDIQMQHNPTGATGGAAGCPGSSCSDSQGILTNPIGTNYTNGLAAGFSPPAYIVDIGQSSAPKTYQMQVNPSDSSDPQLVRCDSNGCAVLADQIIGFKVGAALWSNEANGQPDIANYYYDSSQYCTEWNGVDCNTNAQPNAPYDFTLVRAIRISLIARTAPHTDTSLNKFANGFDGGPYLVQQASTVVDLRGISIGDFQN